MIFHQFNNCYNSEYPGMVRSEQHWGGGISTFLPNGVQLTEWLCDPKCTLYPAANTVERDGARGGWGDAGLRGRLPKTYDDISVAQHTYTDSSPCNYRMTTPRLRVSRLKLSKECTVLEIIQVKLYAIEVIYCD